MVRQFPPQKPQGIYISVPICYENKEVKCDVHLFDIKHCNLLNGDTAFFIGYFATSKRKIKSKQKF